ncbi:MAG: hypothetical protein JW852_09525 [Spirochaetales bacterium]|nr:hypothetical protein [Spirochaetales bacterium]
MPELNREQKIVLVIGASLIILGAGFLLLEMFGVKSASGWVPLIAGVIALALAAVTRLPGFTIIGALLTFGGGGLLLYLAMAEHPRDGLAEAVFLLFVSAGFCSVPVLTRLLDKKTLLWPLIPGVAGLLAGIVLLI